MRAILTGGIASGKSTVVTVLREHGIKIIDADVISKDVFNDNLSTIKTMFKTDLNGNELRGFIGSVIFSNDAMKTKLEQLMLPLIRLEIDRQSVALVGQIFIIDMPLYFESKNFLDDDYVIVVSIPLEQQLERLMKRNNFTEDEAMSRINAQLPRLEKEAKADYIIRNEGSIGELKLKVDNFIKHFFVKYEQTGV